MAFEYPWWVGVLGALFIFGLAIFAHELGHFIMAKLTGVGVKEFAIGMGPKVVSIRYGETDYSIRGVPFGGFVMLAGAMPDETEEVHAAVEADAPLDAKSLGAQDTAPVATEEKKDLGESVMEDVEALRGKPTWVKVLIFAAGVSMNFVVSMLAVGIMYSAGVKIPAPMPAQFGQVEESSPYYKAGLRTLDQVLAVNGKKVNDWEDVLIESVKAGKESQNPVTFTVRRDNQDLTLKVPALYNPQHKDDPFPLEPPFPAVIAAVIPNGPADRAKPSIPQKQDGLLAGDRILEVNDTPVKYFFEAQKYIKSNPDQSIKLKVKREGVAQPILFYPVIKPNPEKPQEGQLGVMKGNDKQEFVKEPVVTAFMNAPGRTFAQAVFVGTMTFQTLGKMVTKFKAVKGEVSGPVGIISMAYRASRSGLQSFLNLFVVLNLALMIFNLLPIPVLDGGHIAISVIEGVTRRQIPTKILTNTYTVVAVLLISLMLLLTLQDIKTWIFKL